MDLCIVTDSTSSMGTYLQSLLPSIQELIHIFKLCSNIKRVGILGYYDYCDREVTRWSGWHSNTSNLIPFVKSMRAVGGGDIPEAAKTAVWELLKNINNKTLVIWYTDAPPHMNYSKDMSLHSNCAREKAVLGDNFDWTILCQKLAAAGAEVWVLLRTNDTTTMKLYTHMSEVTGGKNLLLDSESTCIIGKTTIGIILSLMGHSYDFLGVREAVRVGQEPIKKEADINYHNIALQNVVMPELSTAGKEFIAKFEKDLSFKNVVYEVFNAVLTPQSIKSITYNPLFGTLWRAICKDRKDPRRVQLLDSISKVIQGLNAIDKVYMQDFIEKSYNQASEIMDMIEECGRFKVPAVILASEQLINKWTSKEILEVTRSCSPASLKRLGCILTNLRVVNKEPECRFIPLAFSGSSFFACLPHLVVEGVMFSFRASIVMAMLVVFTGVEIILPKALRFLQDSMGKWLQMDVPENFSYEFIKLALKVDAMCPPPGCLTCEERTIFKALHRIGGIKINHSTLLRLQLPYHSHKTKRPDYKQRCSRCSQFRSFTMMSDGDICGLCLAVPGESWVCQDQSSSYWCECKTCQVHYAVEDVANLKVAPKCHHCRSKQSAPFIKCTTCCNKFACNQKYITDNSVEEWKCPTCAFHAPPPPHIVEVYLKDFLEGADEIFAAKSLWSIHESSPPMSINESFPKMHQGKPVLNISDIEKTLNEWIVLEKNESGTCMFCFGEMSKSKLNNVCDRRRCGSKACTECLLAWYGEPKPGHLLNIGNLTCPFCRNAPSSKILKKYNKELCTLKGIPRQDSWDHAWTYAWCKDCYHAKKYMEKACTAQQQVSPSKFVCEDCDTSTNLNCKECPSCGVMVEKKSGCDHISCTCGTHWCFACSHVSTRSQIYDHMWNVHGNIGLVDNDDQDDDYDHQDDDYDNDSSADGSSDEDDDY